MSTLKPREATLVIYQGDDLAHLAELRQAADVAQRKVDAYQRAVEDGTDRLGDDAPSAQAEKDAYDAAVDEATDRAVIIKLHHIGKRRFRDLMLEHPPRQVETTKTDPDGVERKVTETHPDDEPYGVNVDTFSFALLRFVDPADDTARTIVEPDLSPAALRTFVEDELSDGDFEDAWVTAYYLNRAPAADPKASRYSNDSPRSTETSR